MFTVRTGTKENSHLHLRISEHDLICYKMKKLDNSEQDIYELFIEQNRTEQNCIHAGKLAGHSQVT